MPINFKLDFSNIKGKSLKQSFKAVTDTTSQVYVDVKRYSPIDTGTYESGHHNKGVVMKGNRVIGIVENTGEYVERVESGFRKKAVNWHISNIGQIYHSVGANVYQKALAKHKDNFIKNLKLN